MEIEVTKMRSARDLRSELYVDDISDWFFEYDSGYIGDVIQEIADSNVDLGSNRLWDWAKENTEYIDEAVMEFGVESKGFCVERLFQQGQYLYYSNMMYENLDKLIKFYAYNYIYRVLDIDEMEESKADELGEFLETLDNNNKIEEIIEKIDELFGGEKDDNNN